MVGFSGVKSAYVLTVLSNGGVAINSNEVYMCQLAYHNCPACQEEVQCEQSNYECPYQNSLDWICSKCEWWINEERRADERYERLMLERKEWEQNNGYN